MKVFKFKNPEKYTSSRYLSHQRAAKAQADSPKPWLLVYIKYNVDKLLVFIISVSSKGSDETVHIYVQTRPPGFSYTPSFM